MEAQSAEVDPGVMGLRTAQGSGEVINTGTTQQPKCGDVEWTGRPMRMAN